MNYFIVEGKSLKEVREQLRIKYGNDVYIINVKQEKRGFLKKQNWYVVTAGLSDNARKKIKKTIETKKNINENYLLNSGAVNNSIEKPKMNENKKKENLETTDEELKKKLEVMEEKIDKLLNKKEIKESSLVDKYLDSLENLEFSKEYIKYLKKNLKKELTFEEASDINIIKEKTYEKIMKNIEIDEKNKVKKGDVIVLVGPTGVGKTTTLVKIATQFRVYSDMSMKFLTIDQYKIGAVDHLSNYANILKVQCEVIHSKDEFIKNIIDDTDLIFVDTLGTSQKDNSHLAIIKDRIDVKKKNLKIYLTISATTKYNDILDIMERFKFLNYNKIIVTKLDETNYIGSVISALWKNKYPIAYMTNGQEVVDTLIEPDKKYVMDLLFQEEKVYD